MIYLCVTADLTSNINKLAILDSPEAPAEYCFKLVCTSCREAHGSPIFINAYETKEMAGSKGVSSFVAKCKFCGNEISIGLMRFESSLVNPETITDQDFFKGLLAKRKKLGINNLGNEYYIPLQLDCRGCDIIHWEPSNLTFEVTLNTGTILGAQLEDNEWYDYDENSGEEVSVTNISHVFKKGLSKH